MSQPKIILGDLVRFYTSVAHWERDYLDRNPGVVVEIGVHQNPRYTGNMRQTAKVLWRNGESTYEHITFLRRIDNNGI